MTLPARARFLRKSINNSWIRITLGEGRNRQVKRMCAAVDHPAIKIKRVSFGTLSLGDLEPGRSRYLTREEVKSLYKLVALEK
jgi:pseudouridine synthase